FARLKVALPDGRWQLLTQNALAVASGLGADGQQLPPDWATLPAGTPAAAIPAPSGAPNRVQYGLDAQRLVVWFASACDPGARALAARWWALLAAPDRQGAIALVLSGDVLDAGQAPLPLVAAAAAAGAAGDRS